MNVRQSYELLAERDLRTPGPLVLAANATDNWRKFLMQFEFYLVAKSEHDKSDKLKVNMLLHCAGPKVIRIQSFCLQCWRRQRMLCGCSPQIKLHSVREQGMSFMRGYCLISVTRKRESGLITLSAN